MFFLLFIYTYTITIFLVLIFHYFLVLPRGEVMIHSTEIHLLSESQAFSSVIFTSKQLLYSTIIPMKVSFFVRIICMQRLTALVSLIFVSECLILAFLILYFFPLQIKECHLCSLYLQFLMLYLLKHSIFQTWFPQLCLQSLNPSLLSSLNVLPLTSAHLV